MEWIEFCKRVSELFFGIKNLIKYDYDDEKITYEISSQKVIYTRDNYEKLLDSISEYEFESFSMFNNSFYEGVVQLHDIDTRRYFDYNIEEKLLNTNIKDSELNVSYSFRNVSDGLILNIIKEKDVYKRFIIRMPGSIFRYKLESLNSVYLFDILRMIMRLPLSLVVESNSINSIDKIQQCAKSYMFNFSYNFDLVLKPFSIYEEILPKREIVRKRRISNIDEIMVPHYAYKQELIDQYHMALMSGDPFIKFIGFYHIMEHFYEDVYNEDMIKNVQMIIQHPGFSSKRKRDIIKLVDSIKKKVKQNREELIGSELEALELTLKKYVDVDNLISDLDEYDDSIVDYYKNNEVSFSSGDVVDLRDVTNEKLYKKLASRIYKTRNSLVHNKSNENRLNDRGIYKPFVDNKELLKEIPLMRYISEAIIIGSASNL